MFAKIVTVLAAIGTLVYGTSCGYPPPCAAFGPESIVFIGRIFAVEGVVSEQDESHSIRVKVVEPFLNSPGLGEEVEITVIGDNYRSGDSYLIDAYRSEDGTLGLKICGLSSDISSSFIQDYVSYLRDLDANHVISTSLQAYVTSSYRPVEGVQVIAQSEASTLQAVTDEEGYVSFSNVEPARYTLSVVTKSFEPEIDESLTADVNVPYGRCLGVQFELRPKNHKWCCYRFDRQACGKTSHRFVRSGKSDRVV